MSQATSAEKVVQEIRRKPRRPCSLVLPGPPWVTGWRRATMDVLQLSKSSQRTMGRVDRAPSHAATSNSVLMN